MVLKKDTIPIGELPPPGIVPRRMLAQVIRQDRYGIPLNAFKEEEIEVPEVGPQEVLVAVMAAGVNYNNVWAARGYPLDVINFRNRNGDLSDFHICGSDASGIVYKTGSSVTSIKVGDEVVIAGGQYELPQTHIKSDPLFLENFRAWGYETNWGSFAQFCLVKEMQLLPKPAHLTWEEASVYVLSGVTAYRMLYNWEPNVISKNEAVLIWGAAGGLGVMAMQLVVAAGGIAIAVVNSEKKKAFCMSHGAHGVVNRTEFNHWGALKSEFKGIAHETAWKNEVVRFQNRVLAISGGLEPGIVIEHPGESTLPTSMHVCRKGGMVVICGGTSGYSGTMDLQSLWKLQKRLQGTHFANRKQWLQFNALVIDRIIHPVLARTFKFDETALSCQLMNDHKHPPGNMAILIGSPEIGQGAV